MLIRKLAILLRKLAIPDETLIIMHRKLTILLRELTMPDEKLTILFRIRRKPDTSPSRLLIGCPVQSYQTSVARLSLRMKSGPLSPCAPAASRSTFIELQ